MNDDRLQILAHELSRLAPDDLEQVLAMVAELRDDPEPPPHRDVPFMDFLE